MVYISLINFTLTRTNSYRFLINLCRQVTCTASTPVLWLVGILQAVFCPWITMINIYLIYTFFVKTIYEVIEKVKNSWYFWWFLVCMKRQKNLRKYTKGDCCRTTFCLTCVSLNKLYNAPSTTSNNIWLWFFDILQLSKLQLNIS